MYGKRKPGRKEPLMAENDPPPRFITTGTAPGTISRPSARSERAALAAQQWEEIEQELRDAKARYEIEINQKNTEIYELKGRLVTFESANSILNADCELLRVRGEANNNKLEALKAKLEVAARIIIELNEELRKSGLNGSTEAHNDEAHKAVEDSLTSPQAYGTDK